MIAIIAAMAKNRTIGNKGRLPWNIPEEFNLFKKTIKGSTLVVGRRTFESMRPRRGVRIIVVSSSLTKAKNAIICRTPEEAVRKARSLKKDVFVLGGAEIFKQMLKYTDIMYLSYIKRSYSGDTSFPRFNKRDWKIEAVEKHKAFDRIVYSRKR